MSADSFSSCPTAEGVVTHGVTEAEAGWAGTLGVKDWQPQSVFYCQHKLCRVQVETQRLEGGAVEPILGMG